MEEIFEFRQDVLNTLQDILNSISTNGKTYFENALTRLESIVLAINDHVDKTIIPIQIKNLIEDAIAIILYELSEPIVKCVGRPSISIDLAQLEYLVSKKFTVPTIAKYFNVSRNTILRRMRLNGLSIRNTYSVLNDEELSAQVGEILLNYPNTGYKRMKGYLFAKGIRVTDLRVRNIMRTVDPEGVYQRTLRRNRIIRRREYYVKYSNQIWHIDGNAKLMRWGIMIRCGIDGKSRTVTYISATNNNRSNSHLEDFMVGVNDFGIPMRTRSDKGGENVLIAEFMIKKRGLHRNSHICGRSVHNQRIERFWRDLFEGCIMSYYFMFYKMEDDGVLNIDNFYHIKLLQHIFLPRINNHLQIFINGWNNHPLSTENNMTPLQLMLLHLPPPDTDIFLSLEDLEEVDFQCNTLDDLQNFTGILELDDEEGLPNEVINAISLLDIHRESNTFGYDIFKEGVKILSSTNC